jgi:hypothetical protein
MAIAFSPLGTTAGYFTVSEIFQAFISPEKMSGSVSQIFAEMK